MAKHLTERFFLDDLARIRPPVKLGALLRLSVKTAGAKDQSNVSAEAHEALKNELQPQLDAKTGCR